MKKQFFAGFALLVLVGFSSCSTTPTTCYTCSISSDPSCQVDICNNGVTAVNCAGSLQSGNTNEELRQAYVNAGYTCTAK